MSLHIAERQVIRGLTSDVNGGSPPVHSRSWSKSSKGSKGSNGSKAISEEQTAELRGYDGNELYLLRQTDQLAYSYTKNADGTVWHYSRFPEKQRGNINIVLHKGARGWLVEKGGRPLLLPATTTVPTDGIRPPLGLWTSPGKDGPGWILTDTYPDQPPLECPMRIELPFLTGEYSETGRVARVLFTFTGSAISDDPLEQCFAWFTRIVQNLSTRPRMKLFVVVLMQNAPVPTMRHVRRVLGFTSQVGELLFLSVQLLAIVLRPKGLAGRALVAVIDWVRKTMPPPWEDITVPTLEEAEAAIDAHTASYASEPELISRRGGRDEDEVDSRGGPPAGLERECIAGARTAAAPQNVLQGAPTELPPAAPAGAKAAREEPSKKEAPAAPVPRAGPFNEEQEVVVSQVAINDGREADERAPMSSQCGLFLCFPPRRG